MDITEIRQRRNSLQEDIATLIKKFESETNVRIDRVTAEVLRLYNDTQSDPVGSDYRVNVKLGI